MSAATGGTLRDPAARVGRPDPVHLVHAVVGARIRQRRIYEAEGVEVPYEEVARATRLRMSRTVVLNDSDLADLPLPGVKTIEVLDFLPSDHTWARDVQGPAVPR
ncbi:Ku protein [Streptomyces lydicus]|uniref:Ku protein n=1 Tax=Streptomyces lydicus TaxID=47763 RepID=UPI00379F00D3